MNLSEFNNIVKHQSNQLFRFIVKSTNDINKAKDITQDAFERLWINHSKVVHVKAKAFLFKTAYHLIIDDSRKKKSGIKYVNDMQNTQKKNEINENFDLMSIMQNALQLLPENQRLVITLRDMEGYSYKEIGEITQLTESQVKVYIYRARLFLKEHLVKLNIFVHEN